MGTIQNNHGFSMLDPIRWNGASWVKAGPAIGESFYAQAVVDSVGDSNEFSAIITGTIDNYSHGMLVGYYYLSDSVVGEYVDSAPDFAQKLLFVQDSDTVFVYGQPPSGGGGGGGGGTFDFDAAFATKTTDDLAEGVINLYYTTARVESDINDIVTKDFIDALNVDADTLDGQHGAFYLDYNNFTNVPPAFDSADIIALTFDSADVIGIIQNIVTQAFVNGLNVDAAYLGGHDSSYYLNYNNFSNTPTIIDSADVIAIVGDVGVDSATVSAIASQLDSDVLAAANAYADGKLHLDSADVAAIAGTLDAALPILDSADVAAIAGSLDDALPILDSADVSSIVTSTVDKTYVDALNINADTLDGQEGSYYLDYTNFTNVPNVLDSSDVISIIGPHFDSVDAQGILDSNFAHDVTFGQDVSINGVLYFQTDSSGIPAVTGEVSWSPTEQTLQLGWENSNTHYVGQELCYRGRNTTGSTITKGSLVYASDVIGASGQYRIAPYIADGSILTDAVLGLAKEDIPDNADGYIVYWGRVRGIDTSAFANGDYVYGSPTTPGALTGVLPTPPNDEFYVGQVINSHVNNGSIMVRVVNGLRMEYLHNVWVDSDGAGNRVASHNDALIWDSAVGHWRNTQIDYSILANTPTIIDSAAVSSIIVADVDTTFVNNLNVDATTLGGHDSSYYLNFNNLNNTPNILDSADVANIASVTERKTYYYSAVGAQSSFSGIDDRGQTMSYDSDNIDVFLNGVLLDLQDFTANDGISVVLDSAADSGDLLTVQSYAPFVQTVTNVNDLYDINAANPNHRDIMQYDSNVGQWTLVPVNDFRIDVYDANGVLLNV